MYKNNATGILGIIVVIVLLIILVILSNVNIDKLSFIEGAFGKIVTPIQNGFVMLKNKISRNDEFFTDIANLEKENEELKMKISQLEQAQRELEIIKAENTTLKEYMNLTEKYSSYKTVPAYIIGKDIQNIQDLIDKLEVVSEEEEREREELANEIHANEVYVNEVYANEKISSNVVF